MKNRDEPQLVLPAPGRPRWVADSPQSPLLYLGWGERDFYVKPLPMHPKVGWSYTLIRSGGVRVVLPGESRQMEAGSLLIASPDCLFGFSHEKGGRCDLLVWIWKQRPAFKGLRPREKQIAFWELSRESQRELGEVHNQCRKEIAKPDEFTGPMFRSARTRIDVAVARQSPDASTHDADEQRFELAQQWINANLEVRNPAASLCDYLQVSPSTLHKLFRAYAGDSPGAFHRRLKLAEARRLIDEQGWLVKQAAYHLGYRHANDLSRAMGKAKQ